MREKKPSARDLGARSSVAATVRVPLRDGAGSKSSNGIAAAASTESYVAPTSTSDTRSVRSAPRATGTSRTSWKAHASSSTTAGFDFITSSSPPKYDSGAAPTRTSTRARRSLARFTVAAGTLTQPTTAITKTSSPTTTASRMWRAATARQAAALSTGHVRSQRRCSASNARATASSKSSARVTATLIHPDPSRRAPGPRPRGPPRPWES